MKKAIFLDRDGVINEPCYHDELGIYSPRTVDELKLFPDVKKTCTELKKLGYHLIIVSNQPGIAFGTIKEEDLAQITEKIQSEIPEIDDVYYCRHHPMHTEDCECRKPKDGMLKQAAKEHNLDINSSIMIGDNLTDIQAGHNCAHTILLANTRIDIFPMIESKKIFPNYLAKNLHHATSIINDIQNNNEEHTTNCNSCWRLSNSNATNL